MVWHSALAPAGSEEEECTLSQSMLLIRVLIVLCHNTLLPSVTPAPQRPKICRRLLVVLTLQSRSGCHAGNILSPLHTPHHHDTDHDTDHDHLIRVTLQSLDQSESSHHKWYFNTSVINTNSVCKNQVKSRMWTRESELKILGETWDSSSGALTTQQLL